jgi:Flp pilus assembly protein TadB
VSRERARRREERERQAVREREVRQRRATRAARRRHSAEALRGRLPRRTRYRGQQGLLAARRRSQNAVIALLYLAVESVVWLIWDDPWLRAGAVLLGLFALPVLVTLTLDRRSRP